MTKTNNMGWLENWEKFVTGTVETDCPECEGVNLNEDKPICYDCQAADYQVECISPYESR